MRLSDRARVHAALGEEHRLRIVDLLVYSDATFSELRRATGLHGNALAHHLARLDDVGLITRRVSEGDRRQRYLRLNTEGLRDLAFEPPKPAGSVVFVCTHNSARSQFAAAQWALVTGSEATSVGSNPASEVNPQAVQVAMEFGVDLRGATPRSYDALGGVPDVVISVCDRARESGLPTARATLHWSTPDPVKAGRKAAFRAAFADLAHRIAQIT